MFSLKFADILYTLGKVVGGAMAALFYQHSRLLWETVWECMLCWWYHFLWGASVLRMCWWTVLSAFMWMLGAVHTFLEPWYVTLAVTLLTAFCVVCAWRLFRRACRWMTKRRAQRRARLDFQQSTIQEHLRGPDMVHVRHMLNDHIDDHFKAAAALDVKGLLAPMLQIRCSDCLAAAALLLNDPLATKIIVKIDECTDHNGPIDGGKVVYHRCPFNPYRDAEVQWCNYAYFHTVVAAVLLATSDISTVPSSGDQVKCREGRKKGTGKKFTSFMSATWEQLEKANPEDRDEIIRKRLQEMEDNLQIDEYGEESPQDRARIAYRRAQFEHERQEFESRLAQEANQGGAAWRRTHDNYHAAKASSSNQPPPQREAKKKEKGDTSAPVAIPEVPVVPQLQPDHQLPLGVELEVPAPEAPVLALVTPPVHTDHLVAVPESPVAAQLQLDEELAAKLQAAEYEALPAPSKGKEVATSSSALAHIPVRREALQREILYSNDENVRSRRIEDVAQLLAMDMARSTESRLEHARQVSDRRPAATPVREAGKETKPKKKRIRKKKDAVKAALENKRESAMPRNMPMPLGGNTVCIDNGVEVRMGMFAQCNQRLVFATNRHRSTVGGDVCYDYPLREKVALHFPNRPSVETVIIGYYTPGGDEMWYLTDTPELPWGPKPAIRKLADVKPGETINMYHAEVTPAGNVNWAETKGAIIRANDGALHYDATTLDGYCRTPVYDAKGSIVAGHLYGSMRVGNGTTSNAGEPYHPPSNMSVFRSEVPPPVDFAAIPRRQGRVTAQDGLPSLYVRAFRTNEEPYKIWPLRDDKLMHGVNFAYHLMKPSTELNKKELLRFGDKLEYITDSELWRIALCAAVEMDAEVATPFCEPTMDALLAMIQELNNDSKSAGFTADGMTHAAYIVSLGEGDPIVGADRLANRILMLYQHMCGLDDTAEAVRIYHECSHWGVMGKKDGYKAKKLDVGRTIQCPCLEMKVLWRVCFGQADRNWVKRDDEICEHSWVHAGVDFDKPVVGPRRERIMRSKGAGALDATAFDRYMEAMYIDSFFMMHLAMVAPGAPSKFLKNMSTFVKSGPMVVSDGTVYFKDRGNPSGFMNTLRLNCWANLVAWCYCIARRLQEMGKSHTAADVVDVLTNHLYVEICGDDSRFWALTDFGVSLLDLNAGMEKIMRIWNEELPWSVKLEGSGVWENPDDHLTQSMLETAPTMVSRCLFWQNDILWESLSNVSRCLKRLCHDDGRTREEDDELVEAAYTTLALPIWLYHNGLYRNAALEALLRDFPGQKYVQMAHNRAADLYMYR